MYQCGLFKKVLIEVTIFFVLLLPIIAMSQTVTDEELSKAQEAFNKITTQIKEKTMQMSQANENKDLDKYNILNKEYQTLTKELEKYQNTVQRYMETHREVTEVKRMYNEGQRLAKLGKFDDALKAYDETITKGETSKSPALTATISRAYYMKGYVLRRQNKTKEAVTFYEKSIQIDPNNSDANFGLGVANQSMGNGERAIAEFQKAVLIDPLNAQAYFNMGTVYFEKKDFVKAEEMFQKALLADPNFLKAQESLGQILVEQQKYAQAIELLQKAVEPDKKSWKTNYLLARAHNGVGQPQNAVVNAENCLKIQKYGGAYIELGDAYLKLGDKAKAKENYQNGLKDRIWRETAQYKLKIMENTDKFVEEKR